MPSWHTVSGQAAQPTGATNRTSGRVETGDEIGRRVTGGASGVTGPGGSNSSAIEQPCSCPRTNASLSFLPAKDHSRPLVGVCVSRIEAETAGHDRRARACTASDDKAPGIVPAGGCKEGDP